MCVWILEKIFSLVCYVHVGQWSFVIEIKVSRVMNVTDKKTFCEFIFYTEQVAQRR